MGQRFDLVVAQLIFINVERVMQLVFTSCLLGIIFHFRVFTVRSVQLNPMLPEFSPMVS